VSVFRAKWLLPIERPPIENGAVAVRDGRIVEIGPAQHIASHDAAEDLGDCILLPGMVNAHAHLELGCFHGRIAPTRLWDWLDALIRLSREPDAEARMKQAVAEGAAASLAAGVTSVADISRTGLNVPILAASPIRKVCFLELISGARQEPNAIDSLESAFERCRRMEQPDRLRVGLSPHSLYNVAPDDLSGTARLATSCRAPVTMHVLETLDEVDWLRGAGGKVEAFAAKYHPATTRPGGQSALELLEGAGVLATGPLLSHVNYVDMPQLERLAESRASVVWCPRTHRFFGHSRHPWQEMLSAGLNVCLGTDSLASAPSLSILDEIRFLCQTSPEVSPSLLLALATLNGAKAMGMAHRIGSLRPGKYADLVAVPWESSAPDDPASNLLNGRQSPCRVWIEGCEVFPRPHSPKVC